MNAYSQDLREKIVEAVFERGMSKTETALTFGVSLSSVKRYTRAASEGKCLAPKKRPGSKPKLDERARRLLAADVEERPFATLSERREYLKVVAGISVSNSTVCREIKRMAHTRKKGGVKAGERDDFLRVAWRVMVAERVDARDFVFVDECGTHTSLAPVYGYSPRGERVHLEVPRNRGKNTTLLASMSIEGMGECLAVEGATTKVLFEAYVERVLAPSLRAGQVMVMDNLSAHKGERVRELIEARDCKLLYLPAYSPDLNPIEEAFAKVKELLRRAAARSREALVETIGAALDEISAQDAHGFFGHCGYSASFQRL